MSSLNKEKTVIIDFDGVIHSYKSGWQGIENTPDPPVDNVKSGIERLKELGYKPVVYSSRCKNSSGRNAIKNYLHAHNLPEIEVVDEKVPALVSIDDRSIQFNDNWKIMPYLVKSFEPWWK